jgi:hypothetical protein
LLETFRSQLVFEFKRDLGCAFKISKQSPLSVPVPGGSKLEWKKITGKSHPAQAGGHCRGRVADGFEKEVGKTKRKNAGTNAGCTGCSSLSDQGKGWNQITSASGKTNFRWAM